jgi:Tfp pilus assembly protein PilV
VTASMSAVEALKDQAGLCRWGVCVCRSRCAHKNSIYSDPSSDSTRPPTLSSLNWSDENS